MRLLRFAAFAGVVAVLPSQIAAQNITLVVSPSTVTVSAQTPQPVTISRQDGLTTLKAFVPNYDSVLGTGSLPWAVLQQAGSDASTFCSGALICQAPGNFQVRIFSDRIPSGTSSGIIYIAGSGILGAPAIVVNVGAAGSGTHIVNTSSLAFTQSDLGPKTISVTNTTGAAPNYRLALTYSSGSGWLTVNPTPDAVFATTSNTITVTANPAGLTAGQTYSATLTLTRPGFFIADASINITLGLTGTGKVLTSSAGSVNLSTAVSTADITIAVSPPAPIPNTITTSPAGVVSAAIVSGGDIHGNLLNGTVVRITALTPAVAGSATVSIVPHNATGYNRLDIPVSVSGGGGSGGNVLSASPASVSLTQFANAVNVAITPSPALPIPYTMSLSANLEQLRLTGSFSVIGATSPLPSSGANYTFYANTSVIPAGTQGFVTFTPFAATGYSPLQIPVYINGGGTGTGSLTLTPASLTFNVTGGSSTAVSQTVSVNSTDFFTTQSFQTTATSSGNWLSVTPSFGATPTTLTVTVNPSAIVTAGTHSGNVTVTPLTGIGAGFPINIPVTVTATAAFTVSLNPASVSLSAPSGGAVATSAVQVSLASGSGNPAFTTSVSTANNTNWLTATSNSSTVPATITISASPAGLSVGSTYTGTVNIRSGDTTIASIPVSFTVNAAATLAVAPATLTFTHQTTNTTNPPAQTAQISSTGASVSWSAIAESTGNWLQVSPASGNTPGALTVSVNPSGLRAGSYTGTIRVSSSGATNSPQTITVGLTVTTPAIPQVLSVLNAASSAPSVAVPGLIFTIMGADLGTATPAEASVSGGAIATTLGGVRVLFDGIPAPLLYVSANQVNGVMPFELYGRFSTRMQVEARSQLSREVELRVADSAPGIFTLNASGFGQGAVLNQNGTVNGPTNPAARGEVIVIYGTGLGQTNPPSVTGRVATQIATPLAIPVRVSIGGLDSTVLYAGPAPGLISGAAQVNALVPAAAPTGTVQVGVQAGSAVSQGNVTVSIR